ncbi:MAG: hypothetical protein E7K32_13000 [Bacteroides stercoris]|nr:hypothetical protein [Bacteroides stercoris]
MGVFNLNEGGHRWEKTNLVTQGKRKAYDTYKCAQCGLTGKSYHLGTITISEKDISKVYKCKGLKKTRSIMITHCKAFGVEFSDLTPNSIHRIIQPPEGENNQRGEWVMGKTKPVLVLSGEFKYCEE